MDWRNKQHDEDNKGRNHPRYLQTRRLKANASSIRGCVANSDVVMQSCNRPSSRCYEWRNALDTYRRQAQSIRERGGSSNHNRGRASSTQEVWFGVMRVNHWILIGLVTIPWTVLALWVGMYLL